MCLISRRKKETKDSREDASASTYSPRALSAPAPTHLLILDHDRFTQRLLAEALNKEGFVVTVEREGGRALRLLEQHRFSLVLLNAELAPGGGLTWAFKARSLLQERTTPLVAFSDAPLPKERGDLRCDAILQKPVRLPELIHTVRLLLKQPVDVPSSWQELSRTDAPTLLGELYAQRATGALRLRKGKVKKVVYLRDGVPLFIRSNLLGECLGQWLVKTQQLTQEACDASVERMKATRKLQGTVLLEMGAITPRLLEQALSMQQCIKLWELFSWTTGEYDFRASSDLPAHTLEMGRNSAQLIVEGLRRQGLPERLSRVLREKAKAFVHRHADARLAQQPLELSPKEQAWFLLIDGRRQLEELLQSPLLEPGNAHALLAGLLAAQVVELHDTAQAPTPPPLPKKKPAPSPAHSTGMRIPEFALKSDTRPGTADARQTLLETAAHLKSLDYFELLGVSTDASPEEVKRAYFARAREFHPDRHFRSASAEVRQVAQSIYDLFSTAHETLIEPSERERYLQALASGVKRSATVEIEHILEGEQHFREGENWLRRKNYAQAAQCFGKAAQVSPHEGEYLALWAWAVFQEQPNVREKAEWALERLAEAIRHSPRLDKCYLFAGYIHKSMGAPRAAQRQFELALQANPGCTEALRELRLLEKSAR